MPRSKLLAAAAMTAALLAGGVAGAALFTPVLSGAQEAGDGAPTEATGEDEGDEAGPLGAHHLIGRGHRAHAGAHLDLDVAADALGMTDDELRDALEDGDTIAGIAEERGVDVQSVIDALVADAIERIDERVAELKENLPERVTDAVNGELPPGRRGPGFRAGHRALDLDVAAEALGVTGDELREALAGARRDR